MPFLRDRIMKHSNAFFCENHDSIAILRIEVVVQTQS